MKKSLVILSVLSLVLVGSSKAWSQDDVVIDLSVLGEVGSNPSVQPEAAYQPVPANDMPVYEDAPAVPAALGAIPAPSTQVQPGSVSTILNLPPLEPQFPVVKPRPKLVKKAKPAAKPKIKPVAKEKKAEVKKVEEAPKAAEEPVIDNSVVSEPTAEEVAKAIASADTAEAEADEISLEDIIAEAPAADRVNNAGSGADEANAAEAVSAVQETANTVETEDAGVENVIEKADGDFGVEEGLVKDSLSDRISDKTPSTGAPTQLVTPTQLVVPNKEIVESTLESSEAKSVPASGAAEEKAAETSVAETAVPNGDAAAVKEAEGAAEAEVKEEPVSNKIIFADEVTALTEADKDKIVKIVSAFENPGQNKIGIFSYNLDNGEDVFKRKRQSLNRATEVRSFLISKGYKNYSIKVVNVDENSGKINTIEIVELK